MIPSITVDARMIQSSGIGTYLRNVLFHISLYQRYQLYILCYPQDEELFQEYLNVKTILCKSKIYSLEEQWELYTLIPSCDIFWSPHYNIPLLPIRAKKRLVTIHDVFHLRFASQLKFHQKIYAKFVMGAASKLSDHIVTVSDFSKSEIQSLLSIPSSKITRIYPGVSSDQFSVDHSNSLVSKKYKIPKKFILYVGNIKPHKNVQGMIDAFAIWDAQHNSDIDFVIIGKHFKDFPLKESFSDHAIGHKLHFYETVEHDELVYFYQNALAFVFPSFYEGFGLPPIEAMCAKCPVICSKEASLSEVCGDAACLIDPHSTQQIVEALSMILDPLIREKLIHKGLKNISRFPWEESAKQHVHVFDQLLSIR